MCVKCLRQGTVLAKRIIAGPSILPAFSISGHAATACFCVTDADKTSVRSFPKEILLILSSISFFSVSWQMSMLSVITPVAPARICIATSEGSLFPSPYVKRGRLASFKRFICSNSENRLLLYATTPFKLPSPRTTSTAAFKERRRGSGWTGSMQVSRYTGYLSCILRTSRHASTSKLENSICRSEAKVPTTRRIFVKCASLSWGDDGRLLSYLSSMLNPSSTGVPSRASCSVAELPEISSGKSGATAPLHVQGNSPSVGC
mmetsp:Transcript_38396/g.64499  ORF Transcript_38396/g.64499 Transcript_38396/m.64499 type:complete len:261 (-) Transcript_38396:871-1653(-)